MAESSVRGPSGPAGRAAALSYAHGTSLVPLLGETVGANFDRTVATYPEREALVEYASGRRWTYAELAGAVDTLARAFLGAGVAAGERVALWAPNCAEWYLVQYATAKIGAILVTINPAYRAHELGYVLRQSGSRMLVAATRVKSSDYVALVEEVRAELPELARVVFLETPTYEELLREADAVSGAQLRARAESLDQDDPINIQYTSGTTGFPKGATLTHANILNNGYFVGELCGYTCADRVCLPVPFYHCFGMVMGNLGASSHGACVVIPGPTFDPATTLAAAASERCTSLYGVPTMFIAELAEPGFAGYDLSCLRTGIMAGSPCPVEVMKRVVTEMHMPEVTIAYGMTETSPVSTQTRPSDDLERRVTTVGQVHPHVEVKVIDPASGRTLPRGAAGELCTRGYSVMRGYWNDAERTAEVLDEARWMHTGDLATMDGRGYLNIVGRIKDLVIRGGENVYPREIEEFLYGHPGVADVQVIGVPDATYGEELMAWVRPRPGVSLEPAEIRGFCAGRLAHFKIPRYVHVMAPDETYPMTVTGKVQKYLMRARAVELLGLADVAETPHA